MGAMDPMTSQDLSLPGPPVVYLPVELDHEGHVTDIRMIKLADGRVALLGYTALDRLMDCCGEQQPWLLVESSKLADVGSRSTST